MISPWTSLRKTAKELTMKREAGLLPKAVVDLIEAMEDGGVGTVEDMMNIISIRKYREAIAESSYDERKIHNFTW